MKTEKNILLAFLLNMSFSLLECIGGLITGSIAIMSDAIHDLGDAVSIGLSFFLERKSKQQPDEIYTFGYARFSVLGGFITTTILVLGSTAVIFNAVQRLFRPTEIHYSGMILFAIAGVCINTCAAFLTRKGGSFNQKAVNLHMLEDVLGWVVVLIGAVVMKFTDFYMLDPLMSIGVAIFILIHAIRHLKETFDLFLEKAPAHIDTCTLVEHILRLDGVLDVHHVHIWSLDGQIGYATMHIVAKGDFHRLKERIRDELREHGIGHATLELETEGESCGERHCHTKTFASPTHHHHHHH